MKENLCIIDSVCSLSKEMKEQSKKEVLKKIESSEAFIFIGISNDNEKFVKMACGGKHFPILLYILEKITNIIKNESKSKQTL